LKIQDGCDRRCAYCRVSLARGKSRSLGAGEVLELLAALECRGLGEAVLTGVNITQYRDDARRLPELLDFLLENTRYIRLRLSSIEPEPGGFGPDFIRVLSHPRIRPHFHLSLQSGSAEILAGMGRPYNPADIGEGIRLLRSVRDDPFLACDIITGFPREGEGDFEKTLEFCEQIGFAGIHAFPYSPRPGTAAFDFSGRVSEREAVRRVGLLRGLAQKGRREYLRRWAGGVLAAVVEAGKGLPRGFFPALSENYLKLLVAGGDEQLPPAGTLLRCRILEPGRGGGKLPEASRFDALAERIPGEFPENFPKQEKPLAAEDKKLYT
jgi:threonylcarbamoyladenosine tRNA methylthiotransferase MtaB